MDPNRNDTQLIRIAEVLALTSLGKSTVYDEIKAGRFPKPVRLTTRSVGWIRAEVAEWISSRIDASRQVRLEGEGAK